MEPGDSHNDDEPEKAANDTHAPRWASSSDVPVYDAQFSEGDPLARVNEDILGSVPEFANATNKALNARLLERQRALAAAAGETAAHQERLGIMAEHLRAVRGELAHAQTLLEARAKDLATEDHLKQLTERAVGRMQGEITALDARGEAVADQVASAQAAVYRGSERLEQHRAALNLAQGELERWAAAARAREEDAAALDAYTRADETKVRDLTRELERLTTATAARRAALATEATETQTAQVELDKAAADFRVLHGERQGLLRQWAEALEAIQARDGDIARAAERFAGLRDTLKARRERMADASKELARLQVSVGLRLRLGLHQLGCYIFITNSSFNIVRVVLQSEQEEMENKIEAKARAVSQQVVFLLEVC
jgi:hypothetical protein